MPKRQT